MKKILFVLLFVLSFFIISCNNNRDKKIIVQFDNNINLYDDSFIDTNNVSFFFNEFDVSETDDHLLELDYKIEINNISDNTIVLDINESKVYGNDLLLKEQVYETYDYLDDDNNMLFTSKHIELKKEESFNLIFSIAIKDGNKDAIIYANFKLNNIYLNIYNHEEDYELEHYTYVHNPIYSEKVLEDATYDANCYFGYRPSETGSLSGYLKYDWTSELDVLGYKEARIKYIEENDKMIKDLELELKAQNKSIEEIAKACSNLRNQIRLDLYKDDPEGLATLKQRNLEKYGHEEGPLPEELYVKYNNSWEMVLNKCYSTNMGMDACCGVYDMYFYLYE